MPRLRKILLASSALTLASAGAIARGPYTPTFDAVLIGTGLAQPHVGTTAALQSYTSNFLQALASISMPTTIHRDGFNAAGDGGAADYVYSASACSAPDNGAQVAAVSGGCWRVVLPAGAADWRIWGADATGTRDSTAAIQAALNSGASLDVYGAPGTYRACGLVMPSTFGLRLRGAGTATKLVQGACGAPLIGWAQTGIAYTEGTISDLSFDGTAGTNTTIDTRGVGGLTVRDLYFGNLPVGFDGILIDGVGTTYNHDTRVIGLQYYSGTAGRSAVHFGAHSADSSVESMIGNGQYVVSYGEIIDNGAISIVTANSHPYNAANNVVYATGCQNCKWDNVTIDSAQNGDTAYLSNVHNSTMTGDYFEAIAGGHCGVSLVNSSGISIVNPIFQANPGAGSALCESGTSDYNVVLSGNISDLSAYSNVFVFTGTHSYARNVPGYSPLGISYSFSGVTSQAQAQNTTKYLGINGGQASASNTYFMVPQTASAETVTIQTDSTPAAGQSFNFSIYDGTTVIGTGSIASGSYALTLSLKAYVAQSDLISIQSAFSATSGSANVRYSMSFSG